MTGFSGAAYKDTHRMQARLALATVKPDIIVDEMLEQASTQVFRRVSLNGMDAMVLFLHSMAGIRSVRGMAS